MNKGFVADMALLTTGNQAEYRLPRFFYAAFLEPIFRAMASMLARFIWQPTYIGFDKIPATGPVILISNHVSYLDGLLITAGSKRSIRFVIDGNIYRVPFVHYFMTLSRAIPIRPNRESVSAAFAAVNEGLAAGDVVGIFPEGQLTYTGSLGRFRPGIEWIFKDNPVPIVPIAITGLWGSVFSRKHRNKRFRWWPRQWGTPIRLICGDPIPADRINVNALQEIILRLKYASNPNKP